MQNVRAAMRENVILEKASPFLSAQSEHISI